MPYNFKQISDLEPKEGDFLDGYWIEIEDTVDGVSKRQNGSQIRAVEKKERIAEDKKIVLKVGLNENSPYNLPDLSGTNHIQDSESVMGAVIKLDGVVGEFSGNTEELPTREFVLESEDIPDVGKQIIIEETITESSIEYNFKLDESKIRHNNLMEYDPSRHRKLDYNSELEFYFIND